MKNYAQVGNCFEMMNPVYEVNRQSLSMENPHIGGQLPSSTLETPDGATYPDAHSDKIYVYKLVFHIVRDAFGVRQTGDIGEEEVMNIVRDLNVNYKQFGIYFKYKGFDYINQNHLVGDILNTDLTTAPYFEPYISNDLFHIFILDGNILGYSPTGILEPAPGLGYRYSTLAFLSFEGATSTRIPSHEIGHCFNLYHDFRNYGDPMQSEKVTRNPLMDGYNGNFASDAIHDTPASKGLLDWPFNANNYDANGYYIGEDIDYNEALSVDDYNRFFRHFPPRINNLMHVHEGSDLAIGYFLTPGQGKRMRWSLALDTDNNYEIWSLAETSRNELYLPFEILYVAGNTIVSIDENHDGTATVCRPRILRHRFQKGLNYVFENSYLSDPSQDPVFDQGGPNDLKEIDRTYDYNVRLLEWDTEGLVLMPIVCTKGLICSIEEYVSGRLISTQVLGSMNLTVTELNEIQVKDPSLYDSLMTEYYYILNKMTSSGAIKQTVFYKE